MPSRSNITHRVASLPLYRLPAEASFAMTLELTDYDPAGKYIELTAQSRYGRTASQVWRTATTDDTPAISISGSTVTIEIARARASVDDATLDFVDLGRNVAFAVVFRDSSSAAADFVLQGDLDFLPPRGDFDPGTAASTSVALTIATGSTVSVEVLGVIEGEAGAVTSVAGRTGSVTLSLSDITDAGTAAFRNVGTDESELIAVEPGGALPALDGSNLTGVIPTSYFYPQILGESGGSVVYNVDYGVNATLTLAGDWTLSNLTNAGLGQSGGLTLTQDGTGGRVLSLGSDYVVMTDNLADIAGMSAGKAAEIAWRKTGASEVKVWITLDS